jgi:hypothetical protein
MLSSILLINYQDYQYIDLTSTEKSIIKKNEESMNSMIVTRQAKTETTILY